PVLRALARVLRDPPREEGDGDARGTRRTHRSLRVRRARGRLLASKVSGFFRECRAALEAMAQHPNGLVVAAGAKIRAQERLLEDVALRTASANPYQLLEDRLEQRDGPGPIFMRVGGHGLRHIAGHSTRGLAALLLHEAELREALGDAVVV